MIIIDAFEEAQSFSVRLARKNGCNPSWLDGIFGWAWHCTCPENTHGIDQQCSIISVTSARRVSP